MSEIWVSAKEFERYYEVSSLGRVKRLERLSRNSRNRKTFKKYKEKILKFSDNYAKNNNYVSLKLTHDGKIYHMDAHTLILASFKSKPFPKAEVNHKNGRKADNRLINLEWVTRKRNLQHARENGLSKYATGEASGKTTLTETQVIKMRKLRVKGWLLKDLSKKFGVSMKNSTDVCSGRTWKYLFNNNTERTI